jgi:hypothetical protein
LALAEVQLQAGGLVPEYQTSLECCLGLLYISVSDRYQGNRYLSRAANKDHSLAICAMARRYTLQSELDLLKKTLRPLLETCPQAQGLMAKGIYLIKDANSSIEERMKLAETHAKKGAEQGDAVSYFVLGCIYAERAQQLRDKNVDLFIDYLQQAYRAGYNYALFSLATALVELNIDTEPYFGQVNPYVTATLYRDYALNLSLSMDWISTLSRHHQSKYKFTGGNIPNLSNCKKIIDGILTPWLIDYSSRRFSGLREYYGWCLRQEQSAAGLKLIGQTQPLIWLYHIADTNPKVFRFFSQPYVCAALILGLLNSTLDKVVNVPFFSAPLTNILKSKKVTELKTIFATLKLSLAKIEPWIKHYSDISAKGKDVADDAKVRDSIMSVMMEAMFQLSNVDALLTELNLFHGDYLYFAHGYAAMRATHMRYLQEPSKKPENNTDQESILKGKDAENIQSLFLVPPTVKQLAPSLTNVLRQGKSDDLINLAAALFYGPHLKYTTAQRLNLLKLVYAIYLKGSGDLKTEYRNALILLIGLLYLSFGDFKQGHRYINQIDTQLIVSSLKVRSTLASIYVWAGLSEEVAGNSNAIASIVKGHGAELLALSVANRLNCCMGETVDLSARTLNNYEIGYAVMTLFSRTDWDYEHVNPGSLTTYYTFQKFIAAVKLAADGSALGDAMSSCAAARYEYKRYKDTALAGKTDFEFIIEKLTLAVKQGLHPALLDLAMVLQHDTSFSLICADREQKKLLAARSARDYALTASIDVDFGIGDLTVMPEKLQSPVWATCAKIAGEVIDKKAFPGLYEYYYWSMWPNESPRDFCTVAKQHPVVWLYHVADDNPHVVQMMPNPYLRAGVCFNLLTTLLNELMAPSVFGNAANMFQFSKDQKELQSKMTLFLAHLTRLRDSGCTLEPPTAVIPVYFNDKARDEKLLTYLDITKPLLKEMNELITTLKLIDLKYFYVAHGYKALDKCLGQINELRQQQLEQFDPLPIPGRS